ncbi:alpha/beta fold hydrolase [Streptomyces sp. NPDC048278]|uniref:thioesterase domain-containing protein n=1 Tax=unclassified Streptomyces TaxID=2593676 RepID=UPI00342E3901
MSDETLLLPVGGTGDRPPLYCVHAVSGSPFPYVPFGRSFVAGRPVLAVEAPGFDNAAHPVADVAELAERYAALLRTRHPAGQAALLGWSFGGVVAHETALRLQEAGTDVALLVLVDSTCPTPAPVPPEPELLRRFVQDMLAEAGLPAQEVRATLAALPQESAPEPFFAAATTGDSLLADLAPALLHRRYDVFRAHVHALYTHRARPGLRGRTLCVQAADSPPVARTWDGVLDGAEVVTVPGDHHSVWSGAGPARIAAEVSGRLAGVEVR